MKVKRRACPPFFIAKYRIFRTNYPFFAYVVKPMSKNNQIFPQEIIENTAEFHFHSHHTLHQRVYQAVLGALVLGLLVIFFVKVDVNVQGAGLYRPLAERNEIKPLIAGRIDSILIAENSHVKAGQTLLTIRREILEGQNDLVNLQQEDVSEQVADLSLLITAYKKNDWSKKLDLQSGIYAQQYSLFMQRIVEARSRLALAQKNFNRFAQLYRNQAVSAAEYDEMRLKRDNIVNELTLIGETQGSKWQTEYTNLKMQNQELNTKDSQIEEEKSFYTIKAPVTGSVQQLKGIQKGSFVAANELLGEISPDSGLIAEIYVSPKDIGMIKVGTKAKFQVDAFNYNQWGMVPGKVISISSDIFMEQGKLPFFKVRCLLDKHELSLKNGYVGRIKKGMTLQARFFVTRRTLFQLLYDKADDWLNPNVNNDSQQTASL